MLNGKKEYLGNYGSAKSQEKYHRLLAEWSANGGSLPVEQKSVAVIKLIQAYWRHVKITYRHDDGELTHYANRIRIALRPVKRLYGRSSAADFGPLALKAVRSELISKGLARKTINDYVNFIRQMFKWAVAEELIPSSVYEGLRAVEGLKKNRSEAKETEPIRPVALDHVDAIQPFVSRQVWALIQLQRFTGARSGELVILRKSDIDTSGKVWHYSPLKHKNQHRGHDRIIPFGPKSQAVIQAFLLDRSPDAYLFSPAEAERERREMMHKQRTTPMGYGNRPGTNKKRNPKCSAGDHYTTNSYRSAITRACDLAFPPADPLGPRKDESQRAWKRRLSVKEKEQVKAWQKDHRFRPHQIRHAVATQVRKETNIEVARAMLGQKSLDATEIYAEQDLTCASEYALKHG
ncbi:MAG: site-specific integrase [Planctomycetota bacterium]